MPKRLFIGIGVQAPTGMQSLPGVHDAIHRIARYAEQNSDYAPPILFLDDKKNETVTVEQIKQKLTRDVLLNRPRIVVYFCGHGAFLNGQEIWCLSEGKAQGSQRILVSSFRDALQTYGPQQIGLFSDACQTAEYGIGTGSQILDACEGEFDLPKFDIFRATTRGQPAYATLADGPLFSKVIAEVLADTPPDDALDLQYLAIGERVVSSQSLATYVEEHLPDYAALNAGKKQIPEIASGFRYNTNDYLKLPQLPKNPIDGFPADRIAIEAEIAQYETVLSREEKPRPDADKRLKLVLDESQSEWRQDFWYRTDRLLAEWDRGPGGPRPNMVITIADVGNEDIQRAAETVSLVTPNDRPWKYEISKSVDGPAILIWIDNYRAAFENGRPLAPLLSIGQLHVPLELHNDPETVVLNVSLGKTDLPPGVGALGWNGQWSTGQLGYQYRPMEVLKGLMSGVLTADLVEPLAAQLRSLKHKDPLYGIATAYLYDRMGDLDGIRRMCLFYAEHHQGIPFDIALLSRLKFAWERGNSGFRIDVADIPEDGEADKTKLPDYVWQAMRGKKNLTVAGFVPVLQAGWARLATLRPHPLFEKFLGLQDHLTNAPFATFEGESAYNGLLTLFRVADSRYEQRVLA